MFIYWYRWTPNGSWILGDSLNMEKLYGEYCVSEKVLVMAVYHLELHLVSFQLSSLNKPLHDLSNSRRELESSSHRFTSPNFYHILIYAKSFKMQYDEDI